MAIEVRGPRRWRQWVLSEYGDLAPRTARAAISLGLGPTTTPSRAPDTHDGAGQDIWFSEDGFHARADGVAATVSSSHASIVVDAADPFAADILRFLQYGLAWCIARPDRMLVHGAVIGIGGSCVLVVGRSGSGKSTVAASALAHGWELLADDLAVARSGADLTAQGLARHLVVPTDVLTETGIAWNGERRSDSRVRGLVDKAALTRGPQRLAGIVLVDHHEGGGSLERISHAESAAALVDGFALPPWPPVLRSHLAMMGTLGELPAWRLHHAKRPDARVAWVRESLDALRNELA